MAIEVTAVRAPRDRDEFIRLPHRIYEADKLWVPPLEMDMRARLDPKRNPFFLHGEAEPFLARRDGVVVGRITAQVCREHLRLHDDGAGFFGFFESIEDEAVARALFESAESWLRERKMKVARGPFNFTINDEIGMLVDGFDTPPMVLMTHNPASYDGLVKAAGYEKVKDVFAWKYKVGEVPPRARRAHAEITALPEVKVRPANLKDFDRELRTILDIFNDAWSDNWGFVPLTEPELEKAAKDLKMILDPEIALIAEIDGKPMAVSVAIPNLHEVIHDMGGKLFPFGIVKLLYRLKVQGVKSARLVMLGIRKELRGVKKYGGLSHMLYTEMNDRGQKRGYTHGELSWTLEDNHPVNLGIKSMGGKVYKTYRIYEKKL
ncbi:MAG: hypothetical protein HYY06_18805 [Deltaproteobacteria bacterium]|nr:hypothetical protein [Deltaproteobacteria bacterium]